MLFGANVPLWAEDIPHVTGYRQHLYAMPHGKPEFPSVNGPIPPAWPVPHPGVTGFYTIYPNPDLLLTGKLDAKLHAFLSSAPNRSMLTAYAEADAEAGKGAQFADLGLDRLRLHAVHNYLIRFCRSRAPHVRYGSVACDVIAGSAFTIPGLDFYGLDLYDKPSPTLFHALNQWKSTISYVQPRPTLVIAETNTRFPERRPFWFSAIYGWLRAQEKAGVQVAGMFLYYDRDSALSGPWQSEDAATVQAVKLIAENAKLS